MEIRRDLKPISTILENASVSADACTRRTTAERQARSGSRNARLNLDPLEAQQKQSRPQQIEELRREEERAE